MHPCARGAHCAARTTTPDGPQAAWTWRAFCDPDRALIEAALRGMPALYVAVAHQLGTPRTGGAPDDVRVTTTKTPPIPINLDADEVLRDMTATLVSWEERVRDVARLAQLDTATSRARRDGFAITQAVRVLAPRVDALLALPAAPMIRRGTIHDLDGADAGLEILDLRWRGARGLPEADERAGEPIRVPCGKCGWRSLVELLDVLGFLDGARCRNCGHGYDAAGLAERRGEVLAKARAKALATNRKGQ